MTEKWIPQYMLTLTLSRTEQIKLKLCTEHENRNNTEHIDGHLLSANFLCTGILGLNTENTKLDLSFPIIKPVQQS